MRPRPAIVYLDSAIYSNHRKHLSLDGEKPFCGKQAWPAPEYRRAVLPQTRADCKLCRRLWAELGRLLTGPA